MSSYIEKVKRQQSSSWVGYWPLNEESGTAVYNVVEPSVKPRTTTPAQNGTSANLVRTNESKNFLAPDGSKCARFDGSTSYIDLIDAKSSSATTQGTMAAWVAVPEANLAGTTKMVVWYFAVDGNNVASCEFDTTANTFKAIHIGNTSSKTSTASKVYNDIWNKGVPTWHHLAMTFSDGGSLAFYVNGDAQTPATSLGTWSGALATALMCLGSDNTTISDPFNGFMSHFVWSNAVFTAAEVKDLATIGP